MSTDLQLRQDLPAIGLTSLKIKLPTSPTQPDSTSNESFTVQFEEKCHTPKSPANKISEIRTCPLAPKKQQRSAPSCKRKISEFGFFEIVARDEIESFFKSSYEFVNRNPSSKIRRCSL